MGAGIVLTFHRETCSYSPVREDLDDILVGIRQRSDRAARVGHARSVLVRHAWELSQPENNHWKGRLQSIAEDHERAAESFRAHGRAFPTTPQGMASLVYEALERHTLTNDWSRLESDLRGLSVPDQLQAHVRSMLAIAGQSRVRRTLLDQQIPVLNPVLVLNGQQDATLTVFRGKTVVVAYLLASASACVKLGKVAERTARIADARVVVVSEISGAVADVLTGEDSGAPMARPATWDEEVRALLVLLDMCDLRGPILLCDGNELRERLGLEAPQFLVLDSKGTVLGIFDERATDQEINMVVQRANRR